MANELEGVADLTKKLNRLDAALVVKSLRSVLMKSTTPVVRQMRARIPVGTKAHRTYKGNLITPGFSKRSIKRLTGKKFLGKGKLSVAIGVRATAWYAFLYDQGPYTISTRRQSTNIKASGHFGNMRRHIRIKPYTLRYRPWFETVFRANKSNMTNSIRINLEKKVKEVTRG